jgi:glycosyl transferase family 25
VNCQQEWAEIMTVPNSKIFIINLDSSKARWHECQRQLPNTIFERISAINGANLSETELKECFDINLNTQQYYKTLTAGEIACYLSHRKAWAKIIEDNLDFALILEDDFLLNANVEQLVAAISKIEHSWHCIKLAEYPVKRRELGATTIDGFRLVAYNKVPARTCAQAISKEGAKRLLLASEKFGRPIDIDMQHWWEHDLRIFGLKPYLFEISNTAVSDIEGIASRSEVRRRPLLRIYQQLLYYFTNKRETRSLLAEMQTKQSNLN